MTDPDTRDNASVERDTESTAGTPLWVKVFGVIALVMLLVFVVLLLTGPGHGPGRHTGAGGGHIPLAGHMKQP